MSRESRRLAGVLLVVLPTVIIGGVSILTLLIRDPAYRANPLRQDLWRAGQAESVCLVVRDSEGAAHRCFGARGQCLYLIRPDGHIGWRSLPADWGRLSDHLASLFTHEVAPLDGNRDEEELV